MITGPLTYRRAGDAGNHAEEDSLVQQVLAEGYGNLRFPEPLESEFRADYRRATRRWVRLSLLVALCTTIGFAIIDHWVLRVVSAVPDVVRFGLQLPIVVICLLATSERFYLRWWEPAVQFGAPLFGIGTVVMASYALPEHMALVGARLLLVAFFFYFMLGLRMIQALRANLVVMAAFLIAGVLGYLPVNVAAYELYALLCANLIGAVGAFALEHATRTAFLERQRVAEIARFDGVTQLLNRRAFESQVLKLWRHAASSARPVMLLMIDIDYFKRFNDHYGHQAGDECLRRVANAVRMAACTQPDDIVARYGGEELIAVLPGRTCAEAESIAEQIVEAVYALAIPHEASTVGEHVSVSIGAATQEPPLGPTHLDLCTLADRALYAAKRQGRNRSVVTSLGPLIAEAP